MISRCLIVAAFALFGVSAQSNFNSNTQSTGCSNGKENYGSSIPVTHIRTCIFENPTVEIPAYNFPSAVSEACHCFKTIVKPQLRKEIISVPTVDRIVQTVCTPHIETIDCGEKTIEPTKTVSGERPSSGNLQNNGLIGNTQLQGGSGFLGQNTGSLIGGNFGNTQSSFGGQTGTTKTGSILGGNQGSIFGSNTGSPVQSQTSSTSLLGGNSGFFGGNSGSIFESNSASLLRGQTSESSSFGGANTKQSDSLTSIFDNYFNNQQQGCSHNF